MSEQQTQAVAKTNELPDSVARRGVNEAQWRTLCRNLYPGADPQSVLMVIDYCHARNLDPLKKPCHIVPMKVKDSRSGNYEWRDVVMPGIYEYRITAHRTGRYLGHTEPTYGPDAKHAGVTAPEWCSMTMRRWSQELGQVCEFPVKVLFREAVTLDKESNANQRWAKAPVQMLTKCTEAAGLREAFPEEFGGESTFEEMDGAAPDDRADVSRPQPAQRRSAVVVDITAASDAPVRPAAETSRQEPEPEAGPAAVEQEPRAAEVEPEKPKSVGKIVAVHKRDTGALVELSTGFVAATIDKVTISSAEGLKASGRTVELVTRASSNPAKYAPTIEEIQPLEDATS